MNTKLLLKRICICQLLAFSASSIVCFTLERNRTKFSGYQSAHEQSNSEELTSLNAVNSDSFRVTYFSNLKTNIGQNTDSSGSCGYVALSMLLSYYDTYWDDSIISSNFDVVSSSTSIEDSLLESPGILKESFTSIDTSTSTTFWNAIQSKKNTHFQSFLIDFAQTHYGYFNQQDSPAYCALDDNQMYNILSGYLNTKSNLTYQINRYYNNQYNTSSIAFVKEQIDLGRPVLVGTKSITPSSSASDIANAAGHSMIAYDYEETNDGIRLLYNYGWGAGSTYSYSTDVIVEAYSLSFLSSHSCSNNYYDQGRGIYYCACDIDGEHLMHTHSYSFSHVDCSASLHYSYCICGTKVRRPHNFINDICNLCGYVR